MANENGIGVPETAVAAVETARPVLKASIADPAAIQDMLNKLSPAEREKIFQVGQAIGQRLAEANQAQFAAGPLHAFDPTADRSAVEAPPAAAPSAPAAQAPAPAPAPAAAETAQPGFPSMDPPGGYVRIPDGVYLWTPQGSEGIPLRGLLAYGRKRQGDQPGRLVFKLLAPAHAFTRAGKRVVVPPGGWVMVTLTDMLEPFLQYTENKDGVINMWIRPLGEIPVDGGGTMFAYDVRFEPSAENAGQPRLYSRNLLSQQQPAKP